MPRLVAIAMVLCALTGCGAPYDDDGEAAATTPLAAAAHPDPGADPDARPVLVDTDLGGDDLVALSFLLRHPSVDVRAVTIAATGLVGCEAGLRVVAGLFAALREPAVPVACGRATSGPGGRVLPAAWREVAESGTGIPPADGPRVDDPAAVLIAERARRTDGLVVVALGPLTNLADLAREHPAAYARLAGVHAMAGSVDGPLVDGVAEWNAAADPESLEVVLAAPAPLTLVPEDAVPDGTPSALAAPVVSTVAATVDYPRWWDLAAAAALVVPRAGEVEAGAWVLDDSEPGRLRRAADGTVRVFRRLDSEVLGAAYGKAFATGPGA
jgi:Inosine-uridine preferring nucleoside hydrolase